AQGLTNFKLGDIDISGDLINHCKMLVSFQQRDLYEVEKLGKFFAYPNLNLTELGTRSQVPDKTGNRDRFVDTHSKSEATTNAVTDATTHVETHSHTDSSASSQSSSAGRNEHTGRNEFASLAQATAMQPMILDGNLIQMPTGTANAGRGSSINRSTGINSTEGSSSTTGSAVTHGTADGTIHGTISGKSDTITVSQTLVPGTKSVWDATGNPRYAIPYQLARSEFLLTTLPDRYAICRSKLNNIEQTFIFRTKDVVDPQADPNASERLDRFLQQLYPLKPYMFRPRSIRRTAQQRRDNLLTSSQVPSIESQDNQQLTNQDNPPPGFDS
ncbi:MAG: hypothetical protein MI725_01845, partial [Pirellulales bacterium]|nr:hypothetical protein [Pirellulales bacterium]